MKSLGVMLLLLLTVYVPQAQTAKVYLLPALHDLHKTNQQYTYDSVRVVISRIHPNVIAVEIRSEDINSDSDYLKKNYPYEMWMMKYWFPDVAVVGFDWLGGDIEGKPIPARYWQDQSRVKYLQRRLNIDTEFTAKLKNCQLYADERMKILQYNSLKNILKSNDAILVKAYYDCLNLQLQNSDYEELTQFYDKRNAQMQQRITAIVNDHPGQTIVILTGDDHYPYLLQHLRKLKATIVQP